MAFEKTTAESLLDTMNKMQVAFSPGFQQQDQ
jgi:hypothetical protein